MSGDNRTGRRMFRALAISHITSDHIEVGHISGNWVSHCISDGAEAETMKTMKIVLLIITMPLDWIGIARGQFAWSTVNR